MIASFVRKWRTRSHELKEKDQVLFLINQNLSDFVSIITVFPNIILQ